jgi:predicted MPP superfamily phosphohydrolase
VVVVFLGVVLFTVVGVHSYLWWRLVKGTTQPGRWRRVGTIIAIALATLLPVTLVGSRAFPRSVATPLDWVGYLWLAIMFYLLVYLLVFELPRIALWILRRFRRASEPAAESADAPADEPGSEPRGEAAGKPVGDPRGEPAGDESRRLFLARSFAITAGVAAVGTVGVGVRTATNGVEVSRVQITLAKLDPALDGFRIGLIADVHLSPIIQRPFLAKVVRTLNQLDPGLVAIVGDLVDGDVADLGPDAEALRELRTRHGVYFVTGNHEYISGAAQWMEFLPTLGVRVLHNERVTIRQDGAAFELAGIDDRTAARSGVPGHGTDIPRALAGRDPSLPVVLLAHQPVQFEEVARHGVDLQLSGHTHGGQMVPFNLVVPVDQPFVAGRARIGDSQLYVTRGVGTWGPPVRVGAPPEITLIELRAAR